MSATTALSPARCAIVLHNGRAVATCTAVQAAFLTDCTGLLVSLILAGPAIEIERRLYVGLLIRWLGKGRLEWVDMRVLHERVAQREVPRTLE